MYLVTSGEMREIDRVTTDEYGVPETILMENAGTNMLSAMISEYGPMFYRRITVLCGSGNNAGDGLVLARHLKTEGAFVKVLMLLGRKKLSASAAANLKIAEKYGVETEDADTDAHFEKIKHEISASDIIVDAIFGTGLKDDISGHIAKMIVYSNTLGKPVVSADIPSGVDADTGSIRGVAVHASLTVTFGLPKMGTAIYPGTGYTGKLVVADINFPQQLLTRPRPNVLITPEIVPDMMPYRNPNANKGTFGPIFILGGSPGLDGAMTLAGRAALCSGAGIVNLGIPAGLYAPVKSRSEELIVTGLKETKDGSLSADNFDKIMEICAKAKVTIVGPGLGTSPEARELARRVISAIKGPVLIDADGLNAVSEDKKCLNAKGKDVILTPHIGEMSRLCSAKIEEIIKDKTGISRKFVKEHGVNVLLKDGRSFVCDTDANIYVNTTGNSGMATPGSGDVLSGLIAALMAHGLPSVQAGITGNYIHGLAGDMLLSEISEEGITAGRIIDNLPKAIKKLKSAGG